MKNAFFKVFIHFALWALMFSFIEAKATGKITWATSQFPPFMMLADDDMGAGIFDVLQREVTAALPEYDHQFIQMNGARFLSEAGDNKAICRIYFLKTQDREKSLIYSNPAMIRLPISVFIRKEKAQLLGNPKNISLETLFKDARLNGVVVDGRSYGAELDGIIVSNLNNNNLKKITITHFGNYEFVKDGRADYTLGFPPQLEYAKRKLNMKDEIVSIGIDESDAYKLSYVVCAKNEVGKQIIELVNKKLPKIIGSQAYKDSVLNWHSQNDRAKLETYYRSIFPSFWSKK